MSVHRISTEWIDTTAAADPGREQIYRRLRLSTAALADKPPPDSGLFAVINRPLGMLWLATWPWAPPNVETGLLMALVDALPGEG